MEGHFFAQLIAIMGACCWPRCCSNVCHLRLPNIIAYILAGSAIDPHFLAWFDQLAAFAFLAEFGVVFLLFSLGLEFSLPKLLVLRSSVFGLAYR